MDTFVFLSGKKYLRLLLLAHAKRDLFYVSTIIFNNVLAIALNWRF